MPRKICLVTGLTLFLFIYTAYAYNGKSKVFEKNNSQLRAQITFSMSKAGQNTYNISQSGKGSYDDLEDISWTTESTVKEENNMLHPLKSIRTITNSEGTVLRTYEKVFDYQNKKVYCLIDNKAKNKAKKTIFPLKGITVDDTTLFFFLSSLLKKAQDDNYDSFYLLSNEPKLYKIKVELVKRETLDLPIGNIQCRKLKLITDMGILDRILRGLIPPTFAWHSESPPHFWVKYEGLEIGLGSKNIVSYLCENDQVNRP